MTGQALKDNLLTVLLIAGLALALSKWPRLWRSLRFPGSSSWPRMPAIVEQVVVHSHSSRSGMTSYRAEVVYSYQVTGEYYAGRYLGDLLSEAELDGFARQFPKGATVQIRVNPEKPQQSVLAW